MKSFLNGVLHIFARTIRFEGYPERVTPTAPGLIVSPADGDVVYATKFENELVTYLGSKKVFTFNSGRTARADFLKGIPCQGAVVTSLSKMDFTRFLSFLVGREIGAMRKTLRDYQEKMVMLMLGYWFQLINLAHRR